MLPVTFEYKNGFMYIFLINFLCLAVNVNCHLQSRNYKHSYWYFVVADYTNLLDVYMPWQ